MGIELIAIKQKFDDSHIKDVEGEVCARVERIRPDIRPGMRIAVTAGSRGINRIDLIIKAVVDSVKKLGGEPFIVPAMGSHGGATAEGQVSVLKELGITPESVGAPVVSSMDVVEVGKVDNSFTACIDKNAWNADGIIVVNRIKPHTSFRSDVESGMMKMIAVGLGKAHQARNIHKLGTRGLREYIVPAASKVIETGKIIAGIGIVENAYDRAMVIKAYLPHQIEEGDRNLLMIAGENMPRLPVDEVDLLIVEEMGKNISGTGMDTNVIGRLRIDGEQEPRKPRIKRIAVLDLTPGTNGNALGVGLADFITRSLFEKIDFKATYANVITTTFLERGKIPIIAEDEGEAVKLALDSIGIEDPDSARIIKIKNTLELENVMVSRCVYQEIKDRGLMIER